MKDLVNVTLETARGNEKRWLFREHTRIDENEWINDWKNERIPNEMKELTNERMDEWNDKRTNEWMSEWMSEISVNKILLDAIEWD